MRTAPSSAARYWPGSTVRCEAWSRPAWRKGSALQSLLAERVDTIERLAFAADACPARKPEAIRQRLAEQVAVLVEASRGLDPVRLHQEAVLLAAKADIREEIDRLHAHVGAARELMAKGGPVGRTAGLPGPGILARGEYAVRQGERRVPDGDRAGPQDGSGAVP